MQAAPELEDWVTKGVRDPATYKGALNLVATIKTKRWNQRPS